MACSGTALPFLLYSLYKDPDIVRVIKVARIRWLGHLVRTGGNSPYKKTTFSQPKGSRNKGRTKLRWLHSVLKEVKLLKVETWCKKALDRNIWGRIIKEAKVHKGLQNQRKKVSGRMWPASRQFDNLTTLGYTLPHLLSTTHILPLPFYHEVHTWYS
jgi:hypothetical protein